MSEARDNIVRENFRAFQSVVGSMLPNDEGKYALMRDGKVAETFQQLAEAATAGHTRYQDGLFSIQKITTKPLDLGFYSHANPSGQFC